MDPREPSLGGRHFPRQRDDRAFLRRAEQLVQKLDDEDRLRTGKRIVDRLCYAPGFHQVIRPQAGQLLGQRRLANLWPLLAVQVVVVGSRGDPATDALLEEVWRTSLPGRAVDVIAPGEALPESHPARGRGQIDGMATAYVCIGTFCSLPVTGRPGLAASLKAIRAIRVAPGAPWD